MKFGDKMDPKSLEIYGVDPKVAAGYIREKGSKKYVEPVLS